MDWVDITRLVIDAIVVLGGVTIAVMKISTTTSLLQQSIADLNRSVRDLQHAVEKLSDRQQDHEIRLVRLESKAMDK